MARNTVIAILLNENKENVYYGKQVVSGHVLIETSEPIKIRGVRLKVSGKCHVRWTNGTDDKGETHQGKEEYLNLDMDLLKSRSQSKEITLQPGSYRYPFDFVLPAGLPASYESVHGHIRYKMMAVIDHPIKTADPAEIMFILLRPLDLNNESPHLKEPVVVQELIPADGCCLMGASAISFKLNKALFTAGEKIQLQGMVMNRANSDMKCSLISLVQNTQYHATHANGEIYQTHNVRNVLASFQRPRIPRRGNPMDMWNDIQFIIPSSLPPSRLDGCKIIDITYFIEVSAVFYCGSGEYSAHADIVIGNVPLADDFGARAVTLQPNAQLSPFDTAFINTNLSFRQNAEPGYTSDSYRRTDELPKVHVR